jgi:hypothetical protein
MRLCSGLEQAWQMADERAEIVRRGIEGIDHPIMYEGECTRVISLILIIRLCSI